MNCLLVSATIKEITPLLDHYRNSSTPADIDTLITGIGLTAATYSLAKQVSIKKPGCIIQAGIAGCFDKNISLGSVVVVKQDTVADLGVVENKEFKTMFDIGLIPLNQFPFRKGWLINAYKDLIKQTKLNTVKAVTVNQVTTTKKMISFYQEKFQPVTESMEGAAIHFVGLMENIPFLQIRSISNYIGERDKTKWNFEDAINNLNKELLRIINSGLLNR